MGILQTLKALYQAEPAVVNSAVVGAVLSAASALNIVLDPLTVLQYVAANLAILLGTGAATRVRVTPSE